MPDAQLRLPRQLLLDRLGRPKQWWAYLAILIPYGGLVLRPVLNQPEMPSWPHLIGFLVAPVLFVGGFVWLSPLPWQIGTRQPNGEGEPAPFGWRVAFAAVFSIAFMLGVHAVDYKVLQWLGHPVSFQSNLEAEFLFNAPAFALVGLVLAQREKADRDKGLMQVEARTAETRLLQSQLHPHVLFNALNGLAELIHKDPHAAEESVRHMSALLRALLRASKRDHFYLDEERTLVEDYLHLEQLRLGERLRVTWEWDHSLDDCRLPPLLLQPLVENAIKHGVAPCREGGELHIAARPGPLGLVLEVRNSGTPLRSMDGTIDSVGLRNLSSRLRLAFGEAARFSLRAQDGWTIATLHLTLSRRQAA